MAPTSRTVRKLPSERDLAFAVCIVESTPEGMTVEEYIHLLRQHVAKGRRENALSAIHRHLDRSSYWRSEYERVKGALESAEQDRLDLKLELECVKARSSVSHASNAPKKRKRPEDTDVVPVPRSPKKPKQALSGQEEDLSLRDIGVAFNFTYLGEHGDTLMRSFYQAHALLKSREKTEPMHLAQHLVQAAKAVRGIFEQVVSISCDGQELDSDTFKDVVAAASRAVQSLLVGHSRISNLGNGAEVQGQIVYAYVQILETATKAMTSVARFEIEKAEQASSSKAQRPSTATGKAKQGADTTIRQGRNPILNTLAGFIVASISQLDAKKDSHKQLFEALAFVLIQKLAACLYTTVFARTRGESIEKDIAASTQSDEIEDADQPSRTAHQLDIKAAKLEAPYLVQLLARLMQAAPAHLGASGIARSSKSKGAGISAMLKDNLAITARERLQRTLVHCMFGPEGNSDDEDWLLDSLSRPVFNGSLPALPAIKEADVKEWFKEQVWRLLGWDLLSRSSAW